MAIELKGDVEGIGAGQLNYLISVLQKRGFKDGVAEIAPVGKDGDNYVAQVKRITATKDGNTFKMIAKFAPQNEILRNMGNTALFFKNEHIMYTQVLPKFNELQKSAGVPENERFRFPICYGSCNENMDEVILLEDLQLTDFIMLDRFTPLTDQCVRVVLKNFAIFHSLSFVLKNKEPVTYSEIKSGLLDMWGTMHEVPEALASLEQMEQDAISMLDGDKYKNAVKGNVKNVSISTAKLKKADEGSKHVVIQHGDAWTNNIMFKLLDDQVTDIILIDYQISRETNPVCDLLYMIFNCTDHGTRHKHFYDWMDYYHTELDKSLNNYGLKANYVYPKDHLDVDLKRYGKAMFGTVIITGSVLIRKSEDAGKLKEAWGKEQSADEMRESFKVSGLDQQSGDIFRKRVEGLVDSFYEFGLL